MAHHNRPAKTTALDYVVSPPQGEEKEITDTLRELVASFGSEKVAYWAAEILGVRAGAQRDDVSVTLRNFCTLLAESDRPKLAAQLVGKLVGTELTSGHRLSLRQLAREYGISKQAVHNQMKRYADRLGLPRLESSASAREAHRLANHRNYGLPSI